MRAAAKFVPLLLCGIGWAQTTPTYGISGITSPSVPPGATFTITTRITASSPGWESLQWGISIMGATIQSVTANPAAIAAGKYITCKTDWSCLAISGQVINGQVVNSGSNVITAETRIADYVAKAGDSGTITITISPITLSDTSGGMLPVFVGSTWMVSIVPITPANFCDIASPGGAYPDGVVDSWDAGAEINWITNGAPPGLTWDRFGDSNPARSSQAVLSASLGNMCTATQ